MRKGEIRQALASCSAHFTTAVVVSFGINLLYLALPLYMLQVYDRVLASRSLPTLVMLTVACLIALATLAALDIIRSKVLLKTGQRLDQRLAPHVFAASLATAGDEGTRAQALRNLDTVRHMASGSAVHALLDAPWAPLYIAIIFLIHPLLGVAALICGAVLISLAMLNQVRTRHALSESRAAANRSHAFAHASLRNAEVAHALGMAEDLGRRWRRERHSLLAMSGIAGSAAAWIGGMIKFSRLFMQSVVLGLGAYLVIEQSLSAGGMLAATIILGRALQPVEQLVGSWPQLHAARKAFAELCATLSNLPSATQRLSLPRPRGRVQLENVAYAIPGIQRPVLNGIGLSLEPGEIMGIVGPTAAGKSTLARIITGVLRPTTGTVRLDGAELSGWSREDLGSYVGYLPQNVELLQGTVAENICRFKEATSDSIVGAARIAGAHEAILGFGDGYETRVGDAACHLSGGQRQRIALARAVYGNPCLVVLDEPNASLDGAGEAALVECVRRLRESGTTVVIISHRVGALHLADKVLHLHGGAMAGYGPRDHVIGNLRAALRPQRAGDTARIVRS